MAARLAADACVTLDYEDGFCDAYAAGLTLDLVGVIQREQPDIVFAPHPADGHVDHQAVSACCMDAAAKARYWLLPAPHRPHRVPALLLYEVWTAIQTPAVVYDVTDSFDAKIELLRDYQTQLDDFDYIAYARALNTWRGLLFQKRGHAEVFELRAN